jgi:hypothetical protein
MSKHFIKPYIVGVIGLGLGLLAMAFEARSIEISPLQRQAYCYAAASAAGLSVPAIVHRTALAEYRQEYNAEVSYHIGYRMGHLSATSQLLELPLAEVALALYNKNCQVEM